MCVKPVDVLDTEPVDTDAAYRWTVDQLIITLCLPELGVDESTLEPCLYPGGETEALARLKIYMERKVSGKK